MNLFWKFKESKGLIFFRNSKAELKKIVFFPVFLFLTPFFRTYPDGGFCPQCAYVLLSNKNECTFNRFLEALISLIGDVVPEKFLIHFEQAALNAFSSLY